MQEKQNGKNLATGGMLVALAFIFSYLESLFPVLIPVPGIKLGLANLVTLVTIYILGERAGFFVSILRILLSGLTFSGIFPMLYALSGGILSFFGMIFLKRRKWCSIYGVSMAGGVLHNIGQILIASLVLRSSSIFTYLGILLPAGVFTGFFIGLIASKVLWILKRQQEQFQPVDGILAGSVLFLGILVLGGVQLTKKAGGMVIIRKNASFYTEYSLFQDGVYRLDWEDGSYNILTIQDGMASITDASCPDLLCVQERAISRTQERIVCLPNRVEILIETAEESELDAIAE